MNPPVPPSPPETLPNAPQPERRRSRVIFKLLFIGLLVVLLQIPLMMIDELQRERRENNGAIRPTATMHRGTPEVSDTPGRYAWEDDRFEPYRIVERSIKHGALVLALVFTAFFLFEVLCDLKLHPVHYGLVWAALVLFYLALLALGEVLPPAVAYASAAAASSALVVLYSSAVLRSRLRAGLVASLLAVTHAILFTILTMEQYALLAGTTALFAALAVVMYVTRNIDWYAEDHRPNLAR